MAGFLTWPPEANAELAALLAAHDDDTRTATDAFCERHPERDHDNVSRQARRLRTAARQRDRATPDTVDSVALWAEARDAAERSVQATRDALAESLDWLRPVEMPAPARPRVRVKPNRYTLVVGDAHFGCEDEGTLAVVGLLVEALKPHRFIWNGDVFDMLAVSRYPKDARKTWAIRDEAAGFARWQRQYQEAGAAWGMTFVETHSNHSGDSAHGRWWRYLNERCPELLTHPEAAERLAYERWWYPAWADIAHVPSVTVGDLLVLHGYRARQHGGTTARIHSEDWQHSVVTSHTHRLGSGVRRIPAVDERPEGIRAWYETGAACTLSPHYAAAPPDWTNGCAILSEGDHGAGVELVTVVNGRAQVATLGQTIAA